MMKRAGRGQGMRRGIRKLFYRNEIFFLLILLFFVGILLGACLIRANGQSWQTFINQLVSGYAGKRDGQSFLQTFYYSASSTLLFLLAIFLSGFCAVGQPLVCLIILFRGLGYGLTAGSVYSLYGLSGMGYVALLLLPNCILTALGLMKVGQSAIRFSTGLYGAMRGAGQISARPYYIEAGITAAFLLGAALIDSTCAYLFSGLFPAIG